MTRDPKGIKILLSIYLFNLFSPLAFSQNWSSFLEKIYPWASPSGYESIVIGPIKSFLPPHWPIKTDNLGSLIIVSRQADLLIASPVDELGYFVSGITADGFVRLDRAVNPPFRFFDNHLMGQGVFIWTKKGPIKGIVAQPAVHILSRERREELERGVTLDDLYVDVGAKSESEVKAKGIQILDAVSRERVLVNLASKRLAGLALADKLFPSLLLSTVLSLKDEKKIEKAAWAWVAQSRVSARGVKGNQSLGILNLKNLLDINRVIILAGWPEDETSGQPKLEAGPVLILPEAKPSPLAESFISLASLEKINLQILMAKESPLLRPFQGKSLEGIILGVPIRDVATAAETVSLTDVASLTKLFFLWLERRLQ